MYKELFPGFYLIEVPLPDNPLRMLNVYLVRGSTRNLLIDNGFNMPQCAAALNAALEALEVNLAETDFFLTHMHSDHCGLTAGLIRSPSSKVMCSREDGERLNRLITDPGVWERHLRSLERHGFPHGEIERLFAVHPGRIYAPGHPLDIDHVSDGEVISYGDYTFSVMEVPGHTPGHVSLHEAGTGVYVSGDHILGGVTPNITRWDGVDDSLGDYLRSLDKLAGLPVSRTLPGHRQLVDDTAGRIEALRRHHAARLEETCAVLAGHGPLDAYKAASLMRWSLRGQWPDFHVQQKCFATGETLAHLIHLAATGRAERLEERDNGRIFFGIV